MVLGTTGLFSILVRENFNIPAFIDALKIFQIGVSWGGHGSLVFPTSLRRNTGNKFSGSFTAFDISPRLIRLYVGLEGTEVLWEDLKNAFDIAMK